MTRDMSETDNANVHPLFPLSPKQVQQMAEDRAEAQSGPRSEDGPCLWLMPRF